VLIGTTITRASMLRVQALPLARLCEFALTYRHNLPDFVCVQTTTRGPSCSNPSVERNCVRQYWSYVSLLMISEEFDTCDYATGWFPDGMSSACRSASQRPMKTGSDLTMLAKTCGPEVFGLTGALEPADEFDPGRALAQRIVASS